MRQKFAFLGILLSFWATSALSMDDGTGPRRVVRIKVMPAANPKDLSSVDGPVSGSRSLASSHVFRPIPEDNPQPERKSFTKIVLEGGNPVDFDDQREAGAASPSASPLCQQQSSSVGVDSKAVLTLDDLHDDALYGVLEYVSLSDRARLACVSPHLRCLASINAGALRREFPYVIPRSCIDPGLSSEDGIRACFEREVYERLIQRLEDRGLLNALAGHGIEAALERKLMGLQRGLYGYRRNISAAQDLIKLMQRSSWGANAKVDSLCFGWNLYPVNKIVARDMNERLVEEGNIEAIRRKIVALVLNPGFYAPNLPLARELNEGLVEKGDPWASLTKFFGLLEDSLLYERNPVEALAFNEILVQRRDRQALMRKIDGCLFGKYGYSVNLEEARGLVETLIRSGEGDAVAIRFSGLLQGSSLYGKNPRGARAFLEKAVRDGIPWAIEQKIKSLREGNDAYPANPRAADVFEDEYMRQQVEYLKYLVRFLDKDLSSHP